MDRSLVRRPAWFRALIAIWGLWFATALSEPAGMHSCPMHGNHAAHAHHDAASSGASHAPTDHDKHTPAGCTCLGMCCCSHAAAVTECSTELPAASLVDVPRTRSVAVAGPTVRWAHAQPFA